MTQGLEEARREYLPKKPSMLQDLKTIVWENISGSETKDKQISSLFPLTHRYPRVIGKKGEGKSKKPLRVGVVFSGGQASGGHNVIIGIYDALKQLHSASLLFGFLDGPGGIVAGKYRELTKEEIAPYRNQGGFDMIGSGRTKIETEEQLQSSLEVVKKMELNGIVIIGGDDSNTNAAILAEYFLKHKCSTQVIGVPKTIDGDLKNAYVGTSFGFDSACKTYAEMIGNICRDAASAKKYTHFIKLMGRSASHIALECGLAVHPNLTLIGEEIAENRTTLTQITQEIADLVCKRAEKGKQFGVILIPEGLIEFIPEIALLIQELNQILADHPTQLTKEILPQLSEGSRLCFASLPERIQNQLLLNRDPHGNVQVSLIETERLLIETVSKELEEREKKGKYKGKFSPLFHFLGYEGRSGFPSNFDSNYCYTLGLTAALLIDGGLTGYMCAVEHLTNPAEQWEVGGIPLTSLMHVEMRKGKEKPVIAKTLVDLKGKPFAHFKQDREHWKWEEAYRFPGPIQFFGNSALTDQVPLTLILEQG